MRSFLLLAVAAVAVASNRIPFASAKTRLRQSPQKQESPKRKFLRPTTTEHFTSLRQQWEGQSRSLEEGEEENEDEDVDGNSGYKRRKWNLRKIYEIRGFKHRSRPIERFRRSKTLNGLGTPYVENGILFSRGKPTKLVSSDYRAGPVLRESRVSPHRHSFSTIFFKT